MQREEGYYWIRLDFDPMWRVAYWTDTVQWGWHFALWNTSQPVYESEVEQIYEVPLEPPPPFTGGFLPEPITMDQAKDRILGAKGTPHRDEYEKDLNLGELAKIVVPIAQFLILNGFTQSGPYTFSNQRCQVSFQNGYTAIENTDHGIMYNEGYSIYWIIGYMTYYGMIDQNFNPLPRE